MKVIILALFALLSGNAPELMAQSRGGTSASEESLTARVRADVFAERIGTDSTVYLIVLWRGQEFWNRRGSGGGATSNRSTGSSTGGFSGLTFNHTRSAGGVTRTIDYDRSALRVVIDSRDTVRASADSTLIVMVDRVDSVGGLPVVTKVTIPKLPSATIYTPQPALMPSREEYVRMLQEFASTGKVDNKFSQFLATVPVVREFIK